MPRAQLSSDIYRFDYEGWNTSSIRDTDGDLRSSYIHGPGIDAVLAEIAYDGTGGTAPAVHALADHQGTVRDFAVYDSAISEMAAVGHRDYDAFGQLRSSSYQTAATSSDVAVAASTASDHLFGFTGREHTAQADRYDYRMRTYDAASGRFIQTDPLGLRAGDTNLYRYVGNDAINYIDPLGLEVTPVNQPYAETCGSSKERFAAGEPEAACSCTCVCGQLDVAASQNRNSPQAADSSAKNKQGDPGNRSRGGSSDPISSTGQGANLSNFASSNPVSYSDPSGMAAFSNDPIGFAAGDANLYRYVENQPTTLTDPSGLEPPSIGQNPNPVPDWQKPFVYDPRDPDILYEPGLLGWSVGNVYHRLGFAGAVNGVRGNLSLWYNDPGKAAINCTGPGFVYNFFADGGPEAIASMSDLEKQDIPAQVATGIVTGNILGNATGMLPLRVSRTGYKFRILSREGKVLEIAGEGPEGKLYSIPEVIDQGDTVCLRGFDIDGPGAGSFSRYELKLLTRDLVEQLGFKPSKIRIEGNPRTTGANPGKQPRPIIIPME